LRRVVLIILSAGLSLSPALPGFATVDYQCVQACVSRGGLYLDCEARCTRITPPGGTPQAPALPQSPSGVGTPQGPKATGTPLAPPTAPPPSRPAQTPPTPPAAKPAQGSPASQSPRNAQNPTAPGSAATLPAATVNQQCVLRC